MMIIIFGFCFLILILDDVLNFIINRYINVTDALFCQGVGIVFNSYTNRPDDGGATDGVVDIGISLVLNVILRIS